MELSSSHPEYLDEIQILSHLFINPASFAMSDRFRHAMTLHSLKQTAHHQPGQADPAGRLRRYQ
jgi:hypothetical protein